MPGASQPPCALSCARRSNAPVSATGAQPPSRRPRRPRRRPMASSSMPHPSSRRQAAPHGPEGPPTRRDDPHGRHLFVRAGIRPQDRCNPMQQTGIHQLGTSTALLLMVGFYVATFLLSLTIVRRKENVDAYMVSTSAIGFGMAAARIAAAWIWPACYVASPASGYRCGLSGPIRYGLRGALMSLCIYPCGGRFRDLAPGAHALAEILHARHGTSSQMVMAIS